MSKFHRRFRPAERRKKTPWWAKRDSQGNRTMLSWIRVNWIVIGATADNPHPEPVRIRLLDRIIDWWEAAG